MKKLGQIALFGLKSQGIQLAYIARDMDHLFWTGTQEHSTYATLRADVVGKQGMGR